MIEFFQALADPDLSFLRYALAVGLLASVAFGIIGTFVVAKRISNIAGAISHSVLGGIGAGLFLQVVAGWAWCSPLLGAVVAALGSALLIGWVSLYTRQREDTIISALWSVGMAVGLLFLAKTPGYTDPMSYLFGNILLISKFDLWLVMGLNVLVVGLAFFFYHQFLAVCFDEEFARLKGVPTHFFYLLLLCLTALTVVLLVRVVGIVMVIALLTLPSAVATYFSRRLWQMIIMSILFCMAFTGVGLGVSYVYNLPSGPTIILLAAGVFLLVIGFQKLFKKQH
ncbi:MAG: metal ABC transporter permease [Candidatus Firestonebacteria bacterium]|nr:metal ABC transporter permease [Candidatus Firestonebacteria bacterium]